MDTDPRSRGGEAGKVAGDVLDRDPKSLEKRDLPEPGAVLISVPIMVETAKQPLHDV